MNDRLLRPNCDILHRHNLYILYDGLKYGAILVNVLVQIRELIAQSVTPVVHCMVVGGPVVGIVLPRCRLGCTYALASLNPDMQVVTTALSGVVLRASNVVVFCFRIGVNDRVEVTCASLIIIGIVAASRHIQAVEEESVLVNLASPGQRRITSLTRRTGCTFEQIGVVPLADFVFVVKAGPAAAIVVVNPVVNEFAPATPIVVAKRELTGVVNDAAFLR